MANVVDKRALLRRVPLFREFADADCDAVIAVLRMREIATGATVFAQGALGDHMVIVIDGRLRVEVTDSQGRRSEIGSIQSGEIVGEMAALDPAPRSTDVFAASGTLVYELNRAGLQQLRTTSPAASAAIVSAIIADVTRRLRRIDRQVEQALAAQAPVKKRLAAASSDEKVSVFSKLWAKLSGD